VQDKKEKFLLFQIRSKKDEKAFFEIYKMIATRVFRFVRSKMPTDQDANDALSTTFLRLWDYLCRTEVDHVSGLAFTIAKSVIADFYRNRPSNEISIERGGDKKIQIDDEGRGADEILTISDAALVRKKLDGLESFNPLYREVIILRHFEGLSIKIISKHLDKTENATRVLLHRAIKELRNQFK
jgi:RNA polymerase sigma-70 factor (ECF subfamily)